MCPHPNTHIKLFWSFPYLYTDSPYHTTSFGWEIFLFFKFHTSSSSQDTCLLNMWWMNEWQVLSWGEWVPGGVLPFLPGQCGRAGGSFLMLRHGILRKGRKHRVVPQGWGRLWPDERQETWLVPYLCLHLPPSKTSHLGSKFMAVFSLRQHINLWARPGELYFLTYQGGNRGRWVSQDHISL